MILNLSCYLTIIRRRRGKYWWIFPETKSRGIFTNIYFAFGEWLLISIITHWWLSEKNKYRPKNVDFVCLFQIVTRQWTETRSLPITCSIEITCGFDKLYTASNRMSVFFNCRFIETKHWLLWMNVGFLRPVYQNRWRWTRLFGVKLEPGSQVLAIAFYCTISCWHNGFAG